MLPDESSETKEKRKAANIPITLFLFGGEFFLFSIFYAAQPSGTENIFLLRYSLFRLSTILLLMMLSAISVFLAISVMRGGKAGEYIKNMIGKDTKSTPLLKYAPWIMGVLCWVIYVSPYDAFSILEKYYFGIKPLLLLGILISFQFLAFLIIKEVGVYKEAIRGYFIENKRLIRLWGFVLIVCIIIWGFISFFRVGLSASSEDYWYEAGVPLLWFQVILAIAIGLCFWRVEKYLARRGKLNIKMDLFVILLIWAAGGLLWAKEPLPNGFFNPGPYPPTYETYPYSDGMRFDLMSQYALIGEGLNNGSPFNRPAYPAFLVYLHMASGQKYDTNMQVQAAIYAVFPVLFYVLVRLFLNRTGGIIAASIVIMRGLNGIASTNLLNLANQKMMLMDFPVALGLISMLILCILWRRNPKKMYLLLLIGGLFGLTLYLRQTILGVLPIILLYLVLNNFKKIKHKAIIIALFLLGNLIIFSPYEIRNYFANSNYSPAVVRKIFSIAINRYPDEEGNNSQKDYSSDDVNGSWSNPDSQESDHEADPVNQKSSNRLEVIGQHFFHNVITSILVLPSTLAYDDLQGIIKSESSYWDPAWSGDLNFEQTVLLFINIVIIALGISVSIKKESYFALFPLLMFICYNLANALGRTSGGRYIVPVDWIVIFYYVLGILQIVSWTFLLTDNNTVLIKDKIQNDRKLIGRENIKELFFSASFLLTVGIALILPDYIFPRQFNDLDHEQYRQEISQYDLNENEAYIQSWIDYHKSRIITGLLMYPRYYDAGEGEKDFAMPYMQMEYPHLSSILIGAESKTNVIMAGTVPEGLTNRSSVFVIGCKEKDYIDVAVIIVTEPDTIVFSRDPLLEPVCPLPKP